MEAPTGIRLASRDNPNALDGVRARVVTRSFGVRIGPFGVDYTSKKVVVDPDERPGRRPGTAGQAFRSEMERERLREQAQEAAWREASAGRHGPAFAPGQNDRANATPHPDPAWRRGLAAYSRARDSLAADQARSAGSLLAVA